MKSYELQTFRAAFCIKHSGHPSIELPTLNNVDPLHNSVLHICRVAALLVAFSSGILPFNSYRSSLRGREDFWWDRKASIAVILLVSIGISMNSSSPPHNFRKHWNTLHLMHFVTSGKIGSLFLQYFNNDVSSIRLRFRDKHVLAIYIGV